MKEYQTLIGTVKTHLLLRGRAIALARFKPS